MTHVKIVQVATKVAVGPVLPAGSGLPPSVALTSNELKMSDLTGHVIDVRRVEPGAHAMSRTELEASRIAAALVEAESGRAAPDNV